MCKKKPVKEDEVVTKGPYADLEDPKKPDFETESSDDDQIITADAGIQTQESFLQTQSELSLNKILVPEEQRIQSMSFQVSPNFISKKAKNQLEKHDRADTSNKIMIRLSNIKEESEDTISRKSSNESEES